MVADDGSADDTVQITRSLHPGATVVTGPNRGVTWNRNRALWQLHVVERCDVVILIEDDARPTEWGWEAAWIQGARAYGHVNLAGDWFSKGFVSGTGTPSDPIVSKGVSGQLSAFSREALNFVGYYDTRLCGYGMGHVEHSLRMVRAGYGGCVVRGKLGDFDACQLGNPSPALQGTLPEVLFFLLKSPIFVAFEASHADAEKAARNHARACEIVYEQVYRAPWSCDGEMHEFRMEMADAARGNFRFAGELMTDMALADVRAVELPLQLRAGEETLSLEDQVVLVQIAHETGQSKAGEWAVRTLERGHQLGSISVGAMRVQERA